MEPYFRGDTRVAKSTSRRPIEESISRSLDYLMHSLAVFCILMATLVSAQPERTTTAWKDGSFHIGREGIVGRSDIILQKPNLDPQQAMPLGNGRLGLAVWAEGGYTAQLNRGDTFPLRLSPGQVVVPGLRKITQSADYSARLRFYDGEFHESGGGMAATTYVGEALDVMVISVTGAEPGVEQTAELKLWPPRQPRALAKDSIGILSESWLDNKEAGASGETFGSLAAITADALDVHAEVSSPLSVRITFRPHPDGSFRILVCAPGWRGDDASATASALLAAAAKLSAEEHRAWWNNFWGRVGLMKLSSPDHDAEYLENLRIVDLFTAAAESRDRLPGSQAGIGDLFSSTRDEHKWGPSAYWHWNLRMQTSANLGAGAFDLNESYFALYRENLGRVLAWTKQHMGGRTGICVPETMRFNGQGYENETWTPAPGMNCAEDSKPYYNARTLSTGAEVSLWIWQQYLFTDDRQFLVKNYPVMRESAAFLLAYAAHDAKGMLHTHPSNAHETKWDVHDPTTDISAMRAFFPAVIQAATILNTDEKLVAQLRAQLSLLPQFPIVAASSPKVLVAVEAGVSDSVIAESYDPLAETHNTENIGLEPVWPYNIIGDDGPLHALGVRTFLHRTNKIENDWSLDPTQAARLGLADEFRSSVLALTEKYQTYPSGLASFMGPEFYVEQAGVLTDALQNALVQDYDGLVRIASAWPKDWSADATVYIQHGGKVDVQIRRGEVVTVGIEAGSSGRIRVRNPWPAQSLTVVDAKTLAVVQQKTSGSEIDFSAQAGGHYILQPRARAETNLTFEEISDVPASTPKSLGSRTIGIR